MAGQPVKTARELCEAMRQAAPPSPDDVSITRLRRRLDSREAVEGWLAKVDALQPGKPAPSPRQDLASLIGVLDRHEVEYLLVGYAAGYAYGLPWPLTGDADCVVRRSGPNLDRLAGALRELHARLRVPGMSDVEAQKLPVRIDRKGLKDITVSTWMTDAGPFDVLAGLKDRHGRLVRYRKLNARATSVPGGESRDDAGRHGEAETPMAPDPVDPGFELRLAALKNVFEAKQREDSRKARKALTKFRALQYRVIAWWMHQRRPVRRGIFGYIVVVVFGAAWGLTWAISNWSWKVALIPAGLAAAPLAVAVLGDRITGLKLMQFELSLSEVKVELNDDVSLAIQELPEMRTDKSAAIENRILTAIADPENAVLVRVNLLESESWWSSRLFLLSALASDYTNVKNLVFVEGVPSGRFVGLAEPIAARWSLARQFPRYEERYREIRSDLLEDPTSIDIEEEVKTILQEWPKAKFGGKSEKQVKEVVTCSSLAQWLGGSLVSESVDWDGGPLTPLIRFRINSRRSRYVAMTSRGNLQAVVDRVALAAQTERDVLARLS